ncbi:MAG: hypothetical protein AAFV07_12680 [Bacteroidota bacterium]
MHISYDMIAPLLVHAEQEGSQMFVEFEVPGTGEVIASRASLRRSNTVKSQITRTVTRNLSNQLRRSASRALRSALGSGFLGRTASSVLNTTTRQASRNFTQSQGYSQEDKEAAILAAFEKVSQHFDFDQQTGSWAAPQQAPPPAQLSEFEQLLQKQPITDRYDQEVLARVLIEVAEADGSIGDDERDFLNSFLPENLGGIHAFMGGDPLSGIEAEEANDKVKPAIFAIAVALSLTDFEVNPAERTLLDNFGTMLGLSPAAQADLNRIAQFYILEHAIDVDTPREELAEMAGKLGLSPDDALRCQIQMKKRQS